MSKVQIRRMFPGAVTAQGFYSYYNYLIEPDAEHIFVIKGGPGVGKSTFMKKIGNSLVQLGYDIELHCCSSDNNSVDGLVIPKLNVALLDGTAPHVVDPKNPGAVDEIINLGEYWNAQQMHEAKAAIIQSNREVGRCFQRAYLALSEAKCALDEWEFHVSDCQNWGEINRLYLEVERAVLPAGLGGVGKERHLFAWAHTPEGKVQYIDTLLDGCQTFYMLHGQPGTGKSEFLARLAQRALILGFGVEYFHNTLDPTKLDLVIIPSLETAFGINDEPYQYQSHFSRNTISLDFDKFTSPLLGQYSDVIQECRFRLNESIKRAIESSSMAKQEHDKMENYYISAMDFAAIEKKRLSVMEQILNPLEYSSIVASNSQAPTVT